MSSNTEAGLGVVIAFTTLMMVGLVGSTLTLVATALSRVRRNVVWYTFIFSWIIYCISFLLLLFGGYANDTPPPLKLAWVQAILTEATPRESPSSSFSVSSNDSVFLVSAASASLAFLIEVSIDGEYLLIDSFLIDFC